MKTLVIALGLAVLSGCAATAPIAARTTTTTSSQGTTQCSVRWITQSNGHTMKPVGVVSTTPFETSDPRTSVEARACQLGGNVVWPLPSTRGQRDTRFLVLRDENTVASL